MAGKFVELDENSRADKEVKQLLNDLKYTKIPAKLPASNIFKFKVNKVKNEFLNLKLLLTINCLGQMVQGKRNLNQISL